MKKAKKSIKLIEKDMCDNLSHTARRASRLRYCDASIAFKFLQDLASCILILKVHANFVVSAYFVCATDTSGCVIEMSYEKEQEFLQKLADEVLDMSDDDVDPFSDIDDSDVDKNYDPSQTEYRTPARITSQLKKT